MAQRQTGHPAIARPDTLDAILLEAPHPTHARGLWQATLRGDTDAAGSLVAHLPNHVRGLLLAELVRWKACAAVLREALTSVWGHDHGWLTRTFTQKQLVALFRRAAFDVSHLPERLTVWRGTRATLPYATRGLAWTTDPATAAWFAVLYRFRSTDGYRLLGPRSNTPIVLTATVSRQQVLAAFDRRQESELLLAPPDTATLDPAGEDVWRALAKRRSHETASQNATRLARVKNSIAAGSVP